jgi:hypothetical protein
MRGIDTISVDPSPFSRNPTPAKMSLPPKRGLVFLALTILCVVWMLVGFGTNVFSIEPSNASYKSSVDIWYTCTRPGDVNGRKQMAQCFDLVDPALKCDELANRVRAIRAFYVLTAVFVVVNLIAGVMDHFGALEGLPFGLKSQIVLVVLAAIVIFWSLLSWAIAISFPRTAYCGNNAQAVSDSNGFKWQASPFMMLMLFFTAIVQLVLALIFPSSAAAKEAS